MKYPQLLFALFLLLAVQCKDKEISENQVELVFQDIDTQLGISFPPVADDEQRSFTAPKLADLNVSKIRIGEDWSLREPVKGEFNWGPLDKRVNWAKENNIQILLTIQSKGPEWACSSTKNDNSCVYTDNNDFKNYVEALLQRHPNTFYKIQFGNEWQSDFWYVGTAEEYSTASNIVYDAVQTYSPNTTFVLGGFTTISLRFLAGCDGAVDSFYNDDGIFFDRAFLDNNCDAPEIIEVKKRIADVLTHARYDEVDIHLYDDAEQWKAYYENFKQMVDKPIIITEFGGPNVNIEPTDQSYQAERTKEYILAIDDLGITEAYQFKLVEGTKNPAHQNTGLIDANTLQEKENYRIFKGFSLQN